MSEKQELASKSEEKKYLIEIMQAEDEEQSMSLYELSSNTYGNLSADYTKSVMHARENFEKKINLHSLSSQTGECLSSSLDFGHHSPIKYMKKIKHFNTVEELRYYANVPKAFRDIIKKKKGKKGCSCACVII
ncbi:hypothetical protein SteCoe_24174 [Stentor coeruleus]|uniref:Uncharacterized protein n=1 Tax=Stentor coeruleus TaxID=5963 RepID=A0A1R2BI61_9CILI|nr:hypothetical protein SteCoe_24174 [Stentor coeruleus]